MLEDVWVTEPFCDGVPVAEGVSVVVCVCVGVGAASVRIEPSASTRSSHAKGGSPLPNPAPPLLLLPAAPEVSGAQPEGDTSTGDESCCWLPPLARRIALPTELLASSWPALPPPAAAAAQHSTEPSGAATYTVPSAPSSGVVWS